MVRTTTLNISVSQVMQQCLERETEGKACLQGSGGEGCRSPETLEQVVIPKGRLGAPNKHAVWEEVSQGLLNTQPWTPKGFP